MDHLIDTHIVVEKSRKEVKGSEEKDKDGHVSELDSENDE